MKKLLTILLLIVGCVFAQRVDSYENTSKYFDNHLSVGMGIATIKVFNVAQISYDLKLSQNISLFGYLGLPSAIGSGISWQQNYNQNGWMLCSSIGTGDPTLRANLVGISYQWQLGNSPTFLSAGINNVVITNNTLFNFDDLKRRILSLGILSLERRF